MSSQRNNPYCDLLHFSTTKIVKMKANHNEELATSLIPEAVSNGSKIKK